MGVTGDIEKGLIVTLATKVNYEVEAKDPISGEEINGRGGFQGTSYSNKYNGYRGYPGRLTADDSNVAVDFMDLGLPIQIGVPPLSVTNYQDVYEKPFACRYASSAALCVNI